MNGNLFQHFRPSERPLLKRFDQLVNESRNQYRPVVTMFLNPRERYMLNVIVNGYSAVHVDFNGGYDGAEMQRAIISPSYFNPQLTDFKLVLFQVEYPIKFSLLRHSQILGSLMGSGIKRNVIGDVITDGKQWQFIADANLQNYLIEQINRMGHVKVELKTISFNSILHPRNDWQPANLVVSSLRIDNVIAEAFHLSRQNAKALIKHGKVRLNWEEFERPDFDCQVSDVLSIRHHGRIKVKALNGQTRKAKDKITILMIKK